MNGPFLVLVMASQPTPPSRNHVPEKQGLIKALSTGPSLSLNDKALYNVSTFPPLILFATSFSENSCRDVSLAMIVNHHHAINTDRPSSHLNIPRKCGVVGRDGV